MISNSGTSTLGLYDFKRQIDAFGGVDYFRQNLAGGYLKNARVMLANGDIVKSTIGGNTNNPNVGMTGWVKTNSASQIFDESGLSQQQWNNGVESIADLLAIQNPKNGSRVFVKSYHLGLGRGGGTFVYNSAKALINDGVVCFNGWIRQIANETYTPYMSGCICDGVTDDGANLEKLMYWLEVNSAKGTVVVDRDMFINTLVPYTGKLTNHLNEKIGVRLVSNVSIEIKPAATVKFGNVFNNAQTSILSAMWRTSPTDWYGSGQNTNIKIFGGGTLDFTATGGMTTQYWGNRYAIHQGSTLGFEIDNVTFKGGTFSNVICGSKWGKGHNTHHCKFIDTFTDGTTHNEDHSTVYIIADDSDCHDNEFVLTSISGKVIACTCELHGSNQNYYNNTIKGYWSAVYLTAMEAAWEHKAGDVVRGQRVFNNVADCTTRFFWFDGTGDVKVQGFEVYGNTINYINYPSNAELATIGINTRPYRGTQFFDIVSATSTKRDWVYGAVDALKVYNNTQGFVRQSNSDYSTFMASSAVFGNNLKVYGNTIASEQLIVANGSVSINSIHTNNGFVFKGNIIDSTKLISGVVMNFINYSTSNADIDVSLGALTHSATASSFMSMTLTSGADSIGNKIVIKCPAAMVSKRTNRWFEPYGSGSAFSNNNSFSVPLNCQFSSYASGNNLVYATETTLTLDASYGEILSTNWFPSTAMQTFIPRFAARERRSGQYATLSILVQSNQPLSALVGNKTIPIQLYKDM